MRTTLTIDDDLLQVAKELATLRRVTMGEVVSELMRKALRPPDDDWKIRNGVPVLPRIADPGTVSMAVVNRLREEDGELP
jgi:hypothetical protein